jgi:peptide/nickel transport system permease protein
MAAYLVRRVLYGILVLLGVNLFTFFLFFSVNTPDDMARLNIGGKRVSQDQIQKWKAERGYDKPLYFNEKEQGTEKITNTIFWDRSVSLFALNFGRADGEAGGDISFEIKTRMVASFLLALPTLILTVLGTVTFALMLTFFRNTVVDFWGVVLCVVMLSISALFYIIVGQFFFSKLMKLFPISGFSTGIDLLKFLVLPVMLSLFARLGGDARLNRAMFLEEVSRDYVRTARAKGLPESVVLFKHVLKNALIPIMTNIGAYLPYVFMGSLVFESFFGIPGLGSYVIDAIGGQDFAIVRTMVFIGSVLYIASYIIIDILYTVVDPRVRLA